MGLHLRTGVRLSSSPPYIERGKMIYPFNNIEIQYNKSVSTETILPLFRCDSNHGRIVFICMILLEIKKIKGSLSNSLLVVFL